MFTLLEILNLKDSVLNGHAFLVIVVGTSRKAKDRIDF